MLELKPGIQLAERYTLERRLGGGGEAETWLAQDRMTGAAVAFIDTPRPAMMFLRR